MIIANRYGSYGALFCSSVEVPLQELKRLIDYAVANQLPSDELTSAQAVFERLDAFVAYVPFVGDDCENHTAEATASGKRLRDKINAMGATAPTPIAAPPPLNPDYVPPTGGYSIPSWVKYLAIGAVAVYGIAQVSTIMRIVAPSKAAK